MNELTIGFGDEASLSMGTLIGDMDGSHLPGALRERCRSNSGDWHLSLQGPVGEFVESLTEYFWRAPEREHLSL